MNPHDERVRGEEAKQILGHKLFKEAWSSYEAVLLDLLATASTDAEKAVEIRGWLIAARKARGHLERIVNEGKLAAEQIRQEESRRSIKQRIRAAF